MRSVCSLVLVSVLLGIVGCGDDDGNTPTDGAMPDGGDGGTGVPLAPDSPWPKFRRDAQQTGLSPIIPQSGGQLWSFQTEKGIFSPIKFPAFVPAKQLGKQQRQQKCTC